VLAETISMYRNYSGSNKLIYSCVLSILESTASFTFVEPCKQYRSTVEFNFIDSTALINLGGTRVNAPLRSIQRSVRTTNFALSRVFQNGQSPTLLQSIKKYVGYSVGTLSQAQNMTPPSPQYYFYQ